MIALRPRTLEVILSSKHGPRTAEELQLANQHIAARLTLVQARWDAAEELARRSDRNKTDPPAAWTAPHGSFGTF